MRMWLLALVAAVAYRLMIMGPSYVVHTKGGILITGCSSGLGRYTALKLSNTGYTIYCTVRSLKDVASLEKDSNNTVHVMLMDVADEASISKAFEKVVADLKARQLPLVGLVNNAAKGGGVAFNATSLTEMQRDFQVNLFSTFSLAQRAAKIMPDGGRIVNVGSLMGRFALPGTLPYAATKFAMRGLTDAMRQDLQPRLAVALIEPGFFVSKMCNQRFCRDSPEDTANAILDALISSRPRAKYLTASVLGIPSWVVGPFGGLVPDSFSDRVVSVLMPSTTGDD